MTRAPSSAMLLWAGDADSLPDHPNVILWNAAATSSSAVRSLTDIIETQADEIRQRYLAWVHDLGNLSVRGVSLKERFRLRVGGSLWAQSVFVEQSPWKQRSLEVILRVLALELILNREKPSALTFVGDDHDLRTVLARLCAQRHIVFSWQRRPVARTSLAWDARQATRRLPHLVQGCIAFAYLVISRRPASALRGSEQEAGHARRVLICGPLFNLATRTAEACGFASRFWTVLPQMLADSGYRLHWLHFFYRHQQLPSPRAAGKCVDSLNEQSQQCGTHSLLDGFVSPRLLLRVLRQWLAIAWESWIVGHDLASRARARVVESFWPLIRSDWGNAFRGIACVESLFHAECFDRALSALPRQDEGLYLMENQGWERALVRAWHAHGHGRLTGVGHSSIRFWDLRYHSDPRRYARGSPVPLPDVVVVNGGAMKQAYFATASQRELVVECEALRYLHLEQKAPRDTSARQRMRVLILGDYVRADTENLLRFLNTCRLDFRGDIELLLKPHPAAPVDTSQYADLALRLCNEPVSDLVPQVDLVLAGRSTSASLDAYYCGARVVVYDDRKGINFSPMRGMAGISFVRDSADLRRVLEAERSPDAQSGAGGELFTIDRCLPRWKQYFGITGSSCNAQGQ